jgi:hypothetical protein
MYRTLECLRLLATSQFHFIFSRVGVCQVQFSFQSNEGGRAVTSVSVRTLNIFQWKYLVFVLWCPPFFFVGSEISCSHFSGSLSVKSRILI